MTSTLRRKNKEVEPLMWDLYLAYEDDLKLKEPFNPLRELELKTGVTAPPPLMTTLQLVQQMQALAQAGIPLGAVTEEQLVKIAAAMIPFVSGGVAAKGRVTLDPILGAFIESAARSDVFKTDLRIERVTANLPGGPQDAIRQEVLWQRWEEEK